MGSQSHPGASSMELARIAAGLTETDVAAKLNRCTTTIRRWETGRTMPPRHALVRLAELYGCPAAELVS